jgi:hypothetical protein
MKICRICKDEKELEEFHKKKASKDGHRNECKECVKGIQKKYKEAPGFEEKGKEYNKKRYAENKEKEKERKIKYYWENRDKILEYKEEYRKTDKYKKSSKEWRQNNKDKNAKGQANYRDNHPHIIAWRSILYRVIEQFGTIKEGHTIDELGYSAMDLKVHMEDLFQEGMTWENWGDWHIDHKKPVSKFSNDTPVCIVNSLDNLQPLWEEDNLSKSNKF